MAPYYYLFVLSIFILRYTSAKNTRSVQENFNLFTVLLLFKNRRINTSHPKLVGQSFRFPGLSRKYEGKFAEETKLMLKQKRRTINKN